MPPMLSIDFGNSYTKVALRPESNDQTRLLTDPSLKLDELNACVPTVAASYTQGGKEEWYYGTDVMKFREETPGLSVYRNWKPHFFEMEDTKREPQQLVTTVPSRTTFIHIVPPGMTREAWETVTSNLSTDLAYNLWEKLHSQGGQSISPSPATEETDLDHKNIGRGFFRWLRAFVDPICKKTLQLSAAEIPVRVSLPSFGPMANAELLLKEILDEAGWNLDEQAPTLPEPLSNAIGAFTEGANATRTSVRGTFPNYGRMFLKTGMLARIREALLRDGPRTAWVLIVDVGGYTADFAMVGLSLYDIDSRLEGEVDGKPRLAHNSKPLGVTDLDSDVLDLLPDDKRDALKKVITDPDQQRLEAFHKNCFGYRGRHALGRNKIIGGSASEKGQIQQVVARFAEQVTDYAEDFLSIYQYNQVDDLILTGGGTMIPAVRDALGKRLSHYGVKQVHLHLPKGETPQFSTSCHSLGSVLVRGATAVGGASLYFDYAES